LRQFTEYPKYPNGQQALGILQAARDDIHANALFSIKALFTAEVFDSFWEQAEAMLVLIILRRPR
jgi:hypothetical protein